MLRGNAGHDIFHDEADRSRFFFLLQEGIARFGHRIHAYCLMSNHVHLVVQVKETALSRIMHNLSFRYTQYLNKKFQQTGHIFQGRFKALLIDAEAYLLALVRYVHLNPLRAGMAESLDDYPWSSHHAYLSRENLPWLTVEWVLSRFSEDAGRSKDHYRDFVEGGQQDGYCREFHRGTYEGRILGDDSFVEEVLAGCHEKLAEPPPLESVVEAVCALYDLRPQDLSSRRRTQLVSEARALAAYVVRETQGLELEALGRALKHDSSTLSQAARRLESRMAHDDCLVEKVMQVQKNIPVCQA
ncbi:transposase [Desulfuromonas sp. AOP6]|uniref:transposase n=1 Tax=Desulfuromonas sp. AOP6 TaxID=1566351 RepID=UPI001281315A|nr:transposase [Desulfuromonas sp. AOP6]BCA80644.1 transposase [Desulfuromonas sp. AOP6]